jgi:hypothetical protein
VPIWPVSFVDGIYQVADADGAHYPITMQGNSVSRFNPGWTPRGLQTGLAPFHILELVHEAGGSTFWLLDGGLDFRGNAVVHLRAEDRVLFFAHVEPLVRSLFDESVKAPHSGIPAAAHEFDGFLAESTYELIIEAIDRTVGRPDLVLFAKLDELGAYAHHGVTLSPAWIAQALRSTAPSQETLDLLGQTVRRHFDPSVGVVYYIVEGDDADDRYVYVPAAATVFARTASKKDTLRLLTQLTVWYATHTDRAVMLPEAEGLEPGLVHVVPPPQHGLDEPAVITEAEPETPERPGMPHPAPEPALQYAHEMEHAEPEPLLADIDPTPVPAIPTHSEPVRSYSEPLPTSLAGLTSSKPEPEPAEAETARYEPPRPRPTAPPPAPPRQNWWQRLLGLGD